MYWLIWSLRVSYSCIRTCTGIFIFGVGLPRTHLMAHNLTMHKVCVMALLSDKHTVKKKLWLLWRQSLVSSSTTKASNAGPCEAHNGSINAVISRVCLHDYLSRVLWDVPGSQECLNCAACMHALSQCIEHAVSVNSRWKHLTCHGHSARAVYSQSPTWGDRTLMNYVNLLPFSKEFRFYIFHSIPY